MARRWHGGGGIWWRRRGLEAVVAPGGETLRRRLVQFESEEVDLATVELNSAAAKFKSEGAEVDLRKKKVDLVAASLIDEIGQSVDAIRAPVLDLQRFGKSVKLAGFSPYYSAIDALNQCRRPARQHYFRCRRGRTRAPNGAT
ncbi:unnamed protein product [Urochloa humidicola]